ncbi:MAG: SDR family NAD(P)-dependent oxidoreductase [Bacteroidia bacterium]|nr:SDR family NAD(P)-dependent oxidoreductase [Bacteroidia bacterium]
MNDFENKVVLITGSGSGIGKATAKLFCQQGARVVLNGRDELKLIKTKTEFESIGLKVDYCVGDVTCRHDCAWLSNYIETNYGELSLFVANASLSMNGWFEDHSPDLYKEILDSNVVSVTTPLYYFLPLLKKTKGSFIIIGSVAGFYGLPSATAYSAGKAAIITLQQGLSVELEKHSVHVGILNLGFTENDRNKKLSAGKGKWLPVPKRPRFFVQSKEKAAKEILKMAKYRTKKKTLSLIGKLTEFVSRFCPGLIGFAARIRERKNKIV